MTEPIPFIKNVPLVRPHDTHHFSLLTDGQRPIVEVRKQTIMFRIIIISKINPFLVRSFIHNNERSIFTSLWFTYNCFLIHKSIFITINAVCLYVYIFIYNVYCITSVYKAIVFRVFCQHFL